MKVTLEVHYTEDYPDTLPDLVLEAVEGDLDDVEEVNLLASLRKVVRSAPLLP